MKIISSRIGKETKLKVDIKSNFREFKIVTLLSFSIKAPIMVRLFKAYNAIMIKSQKNTLA